MYVSTAFALSSSARSTSSESTLHVFKKPAPLVDPKYYQTVLRTFATCRDTKCGPLEVGYTYTDDITASLSALGGYTSCVTACAAEGSITTVKDFKNSLTTIFDVGSDQYKRVRLNLGGEGPYDVLKETTMIDESCCLPNDYFTPWDSIVLPISTLPMKANFAFGQANGYPIYVSGTAEADKTPVNFVSQERMVTVGEYLRKCAANTATDLSKLITTFDFKCSAETTEYLTLLQRNVGHLILAPKTKEVTPDKACNKEGESNPRAQELLTDGCVATEISIGKEKHSVKEPFVKMVDSLLTGEAACPDDYIVDISLPAAVTYKDIDGKNEPVEHPAEPIMTISYKRVSKSHLGLYTIATGLPSLKIGLTGTGANGLYTTDDLKKLITNPDSTVADLNICDNKQGLVGHSSSSMGVSAEDIVAARHCPTGGLFEYCNLQQYATYLEKQLFDSDDCQVIDMRDDNVEREAFYGTLACLYKITTLKCDCMEAVLNCYEREFHFTEALTKTIGKAASVMCGFILCQRPKVYAMFGGVEATEKAQIMHTLLSQVGVASSGDVSSLPPATFAFLSFGLGMIAFITTKAIAKKTMKTGYSSVKADDGYRNLI